MLQDEQSNAPSASPHRARLGPPRVVVVIAPKGGVGKSTLTLSLLVCAARAGYGVTGVNMDQQRTLEAWGTRRTRLIEKQPDVGVLPIPVIRLDPGQWRQVSAIEHCDIAMVDTPPGHSDAQHSIGALCETADLVLVPSTSGGPDLDEVIPFSKRIRARKVVFVLNRVNRRTRSYAQARTDLLEHGHLAPVDIPLLEAIPNAYNLGLATTDFGDPGADAFTGLWHFVRRELGLEEVARG